MPDRKPMLCLDFDGVLHSYTSGWQGATVIPDPPVPGAMEFIVAAQPHFRVAIFSSRSGEPGGIEAMQKYIDDWLYTQERVDIEWPTSKPPAFLTIDDRAIYFTGTWPDPKDLLDFKTWQQGGSGHGEIEPPVVTGEGVIKRKPALDEATKIAITAGNADWDGEVVCPACGGNGYLDAKPPERHPFAWARGVHEPSSPNGPLEYDVEMVYGDDRPAGDGWFPLYRDPV